MATCLAVVMGHAKHTQGSQDFPSLTHGTVTMPTTHSPDNLHLPARHTPHGPSPPTHPPNASPPYANTAAPRPLRHLQI